VVLSTKKLWGSLKKESLPVLLGMTSLKIGAVQIAEWVKKILK
jgi:hypothetical protein